MRTPKTALRDSSLARRRALDDTARAAAADAVGRATASLLARAPGRLAAYASAGDEPGTDAVLRPGVLLPVLLADGDLDWALYEGTLTPGLRGTLEPPGPRLGRDAVADCSVVLVPALAVDRAGVRLGRGGGCYDRALARTDGYVVAALHVGELHVALPNEPHDVPVHGAVLPDRGLVRLRPHAVDALPVGASDVDRVSA